MISHIYNKDTGKITVILTKPVGKVFSFTRENLPEHLDFDDLIVKLSDLTEEDFIPYVDEIESFIKNGKGKISYSDNGGELKFEDIVLPEALQRRYSAMIADGQDVTPLEKFVMNLQKNTEKDIREELFLFMEANNLPITEEGHFLAYKAVNEFYKDYRTNKIDNSVGAKPKMDPGAVDKDRFSTCSTGLHFTSYNYAHDFHNDSGKMMIVKVDPKNVMAIPNDYNNQKGRCCEYEVISEIKEVGTQEIKPDFIKKDEAILQEKVSKSAKKIKNTIAVAKEESSIDYLKYHQATFSEITWSVNGTEYTGYKLIEIPAGKNWKEELETEIGISPELSKLFGLRTKMGVKPGREVAAKDRTLVAVISQGKGLHEVLPSAKILLPISSKLK